MKIKIKQPKTFRTIGLKPDTHKKLMFIKIQCNAGSYKKSFKIIRKKIKS